MSSSVAKQVTARLASRRIGLGLIALFGSVSPTLGSDRHADPGTSGLSRAELIERVVRYYPHPDPELRVRITNELSVYDIDQFATRLDAGCADTTPPSPLTTFE
jgi:hypothetical protein